MIKNILNTRDRTNRESTEKIVLRKIKIYKFKGLRNKQLSFTDDNINHVNAPNGAGKTTFIDAFAYVLSGYDMQKGKGDLADKSIDSNHKDRSKIDIEIRFDKYGHDGRLTNYWVRTTNVGKSTIHVNKLLTEKYTKAKDCINKTRSIMGLLSEVQSYSNPHIVDIVDTKEGRSWLVNIGGVNNSWDYVKDVTLNNKKYSAHTIDYMREHLETSSKFDDYGTEFSKGYSEIKQKFKKHNSGVTTLPSYHEVVEVMAFKSLDHFINYRQNSKVYAELRDKEYLKEKNLVWVTIDENIAKGYNVPDLTDKLDRTNRWLEAVQARTIDHTYIIDQLEYIRQHNIFKSLPVPTTGENAHLQQTLNALQGTKTTPSYLYAVRQEFAKLGEHSGDSVEFAEVYNKEGQENMLKSKEDHKLALAKLETLNSRIYNNNISKVADNELATYIPKGLWGKFIFWITNGKMKREQAQHRLDAVSKDMSDKSIIVEGMSKGPVVFEPVNVDLIKDHDAVIAYEALAQSNNSITQIERYEKYSKFSETPKYTEEQLVKFRTDLNKLPAIQVSRDKLVRLLKVASQQEPDISREDIIRHFETWTKVEQLFLLLKDVAVIKREMVKWEDYKRLIDDVVILRLAKVNEVIQAEGVDLDFSLNKKNVSNDAYKQTFTINITNRQGNKVEFSTASKGEQVKEGIKFNRLMQSLDKVNIPIFIDEAGILDKELEWLGIAGEVNNIIMFTPGDGEDIKNIEEL